MFTPLARLEGGASMTLSTYRHPPTPESSRQFNGPSIKIAENSRITLSVLLGSPVASSVRLLAG
jgi:hypothetical protein